MSDITDEQLKEMNKRYPSIRTPAHPFYKLGVLAEEHGMAELLMALSQYCGCKIEEEITNDGPDIFEWSCMDHLVSAIAQQACLLFEEEEAEAAAKATHKTPEQTQ
jgi:hypothetical protein